MARLGISLVLISALVLGVTYRVHLVINRPLPADLHDQVKVRILDEIGRITNYLFDVCLYFRLPIGSPIKFMVDLVFGCLVGSVTSHHDDVKVYDQYIQDVPVRVFHPRRAAKMGTYPTLVYIHGGGWMWLTVNSYSSFLSELANKTGVLVIAPEYKKAPLNHFPDPYIDCEKVMYTILMGKSTLPVDMNHVMVGGDGSGGNLAAVLAQKFRQKIFMQVLINPALQMFDLHTPSYKDNSDVIEGITSPKRQIRQWLMYTKISTSFLSALLQNSHVSPELRRSKFSTFVNSSLHLPAYLNVTQRSTLMTDSYHFDAIERFQDVVINTTLEPMMLSNLNGVASAYVITSQYDVLRDEGIMYASRLHNSDVKVKLKHYPSSFHGFLLFSTEGPFRMDKSVEALQEMADFLRFQLRGFTS